VRNLTDVLLVASVPVRVSRCSSWRDPATRNSREAGCVVLCGVPGILTQGARAET